MNVPVRAYAPFIDKRFDIKVFRDVKFGSGGIGFGSGSPRARDLLLDIYEPLDHAETLRPALILAFGGAWHRGSRSDDVVNEGSRRNTAIADYCAEFARRGYVCFSIDYRLMQEDPDPGLTPTLPPGAPLNIDRVNYVRGLLGLPPCTQEMMGAEIEASTDDVSAAVAFVRARANALGIDATRIAIGGFSAGAVVALNAAFSERAPVAAVVALSGRLSLAAARATISGRPGEPATLTFVGENDLPSLLTDLDGLAEHLTALGPRHRLMRVPGAGHFYPRTAPVPAEGGAADVETRIATFLCKELDLGSSLPMAIDTPLVAKTP